MIEEQVKRLRERAAWINFSHLGEETPTEDAKLMMEAADTIEELQNVVSFHKFRSALWAETCDSLADEIKKLEEKVQAYAEFVPWSRRGGSDK